MEWKPTGYARRNEGFFIFDDIFAVRVQAASSSYTLAILR
jgi:hypothetical protein